MLAINEELHKRYRIKHRLGQGGMGAVYEAEDIKRFGKSVALKEIIIDFTKVVSIKQQELFKKAFEREAKILTQLDHEAFPQVVDYFTEKDSQFLVMELIQGDDLEHQLRQRQKPFTLQQVIALANQLLEALDYLHTLNPPIIHRDIKPQNIKLTHRGKIKLLDFGIAKGSDTQLNTTVTNQTFIAATLNYSPFEQVFRVLDENYREFILEKYKSNAAKILTQNVDSRSDIYALGATLYHLLTGHLPTDSLKRSLEVWSDKPDLLPAPISVNAEIPIEISNWLLKSMALKCEDRYRNAAQMQDALNYAVEREKYQQDEEIRQQEIVKQQEWQTAQEKLRKEREQIEIDRKKMEEAWLLHLQQVEEAQKQSKIEKERLQEAERRAYEAEMLLSLQKKSELTTEASITQSSFIESTVTEPVTTEASITESSIKFPFPDTPVESTKAALTAPSFPEQGIINKPVKEHNFEIPKTIQDIEFQNEGKSWGLTIFAAVALLFLGIVGVIAWITLSDSSKTLSKPSTTKSLPPVPDGMAYIPGGEFVMGRDSSDVNSAENPAHKATIGDYFMDVYEVSNEQYAEYIKSTGRKPPSSWKNGTFIKNQEKYPVVNVNWEEAAAFCKNFGKRLPTEEEWEFAAKGKTLNLYPWGNEWIEGKANADGLTRSLTQIGRFSGSSPYGLLDMVGNAWEWTSSDFSAYPGGKIPAPFAGKPNLKTIRGGAFDSSKDFATVTYRIGWAATGSDNYSRTGFRCVKDISE